MKLLLVEDEAKLADALSEILRLENYDVDVCRDGITGLDAALGGVYDVIVLDVMLPGKNGFEILREIRAAGLKTPVLMLTAKSELDDKVMGLDSGADDYLTKPFLTKELLARLRAISRRQVDTEGGCLRFGDLRLELESGMLFCETTGLSVRLGAKEYRLLEYLLANQGRVITREQLALKIWGYDSEAEYNNVEVYLSFTRKKIGFVGSDVTIKSVRGLGYELQVRDV
ncbi:Response regulator ArlR [bioreactor metagenome]|uniref:Response regulator ArlR n=1 Tax=bioreactor metagenome TaxID=1076179 RepID=A0A644WGE4_9ZZZZ